MIKVKERVKEIDNLIGNMESNTNDLGSEIQMFEKEIERIEEFRVVKNPGEKIKDMMEKWD